jgi:hypothetical protein
MGTLRISYYVILFFIAITPGQALAETIKGSCSDYFYNNNIQKKLMGGMAK